ncbi:MAG: NAD(P)-dependent oxidoreductase [Eubacteriales bacterium]|nr:NAD(P)-dependent oxidoreductase [Eubacteriales bacterium]
MKRILITGPTGAVGLALIGQALADHCEVIAVCRPDSKRKHVLPESEQLHILECGLQELEQLPAMVRTIDKKEKKGVDVFYHLAWDGTFGGTRDDLSGQVKNIQYTLDAVYTAKELGCRRFVGAGSQAEYGRQEAALRADTPCFPENGYGMAKLCAGQMSRELCLKLGIEHIWPRILSIYGPGDRRQTMIMQCIASFLRGEQPVLSGGEQIWDYLYADDCGRALYLLGEKGISGKVYPIGSGQKRPLADYVRILRDQIDPSLEPGFGRIPYGPKQVMHLCADLTELTADTGFVPEIDFAEGAERTIRWCRSQTEYDRK